MLEIKFENVEEEFIVARWMYGHGEDVIDNSHYTILREFMMKQRMLREYTDRTWSEDPCPIGLLKKYGLEKYAENIVIHGKSSSIESIGNWHDIQIYYGSGEFYKPRYVTYKWDGWNIQVTYYNKVFTAIQPRGRTGDTINVDSLESTLPREIPYMGKIVILFEYVLSDYNFEELKRLVYPKKLTSQRAAVRTAISNPDYNYLLTPIATGIMGTDDYMKTAVMLNNCGFKFCIKPKRVNSFTELREVVKYMSAHDKDSGLPTDGIVVVDREATDYRALRVECWEELIHKSYVTGYEFGFGINSKSVKCEIRPIQLKNSRHVLVSVTNPRYVRDYRLFKGAPIAFRLKSSAVAVLDTEATVLLQKQYSGMYQQYRYEIDDMELVKEIGY